MADSKTRIRVRRMESGGGEIFVLVTHPMETGLRADPQTREKIPAHFIQKVTFYINDKIVAVADTGAGVATNPLLSIRVEHIETGDRVGVMWSDNHGEKDEEEIRVGGDL